MSEKQERSWIESVWQAEPVAPSHCPRCKRETQIGEPFCSCGFDLRHGMAASKRDQKKRLSCVYCGERPTSTEHLFGKWVYHSLPKLAAQTTQTLVRGVDPRTGMTPAIRYKPQKTRFESPYLKQVRNVCAGCNNGWMSQLHMAAKPLIVESAAGIWRDYTDDERIIITRWTVMVTVNLEAHNGIQRTLPHHRRTLMSGKVPQGIRLWQPVIEDPDSAGFSMISAGDRNNDLLLAGASFIVGKAGFIVVIGAEDLSLPMALEVCGGAALLAPYRPIWPEAGSAMHYEASAMADELEKLTALIV